MDNHISDPRARDFVAALRRFEQDSDPTTLTKLFTDDATTEATFPGGRPVTYRGVTVIDLDGEKIARLRTYYDTAAFL